MSSKIVYRIDGNGCIGEGSVTKQEDGQYFITYMTFDGYVDDGSFKTEAEAILELNKRIAEAEKTAARFNLYAESNGGMY